MANNIAGFREYIVITGTSGTLSDSGSVAYVEVTNAGGVTANVKFNDDPDHPVLYTIPVAAGTTRNIPLKAYNFTSDQSVTIVGYKV